MMNRLRLLSAFQTLTFPSGAFGVTHRFAKQLILELTGVEPGDGPFLPGRTLEQYLEQIGVKP